LTVKRLSGSVQAMVKIETAFGRARLEAASRRVAA
jgi:hypothetical protein